MHTSYVHYDFIAYFVVSCKCIVFYSMASTVIQIYLKHILESYFSPHQLLRMTTLQVISLVLRQGLVHPVQVYYLINWLIATYLEEQVVL